jgi:sugar-phosphatase
MPIAAVIFDMDGLLIDSEPFWQQAEVEIFSDLGIPMTQEMGAETIGMRLDKVVEFRYQQFGWHGPSVAEVTERILQRVIDLVETQGIPRPGVQSILEFTQAKGVRIGLATSSDHRLIDAVLKRLKIAEYFEVTCSAQDELYGKPHPAVFLQTAHQLQVAPQTCLVFEDSLRGVLAAKAAEMLCVCIPDHTLHHDPRLAIADLILPTLSEFDDNSWYVLNGKSYTI